MGLFDLFNSKGALSQSMADAPNPYMQVDQDGNTSMQLNPAYADFVNKQSNPRNMDTGMKIMMLGQALQGKDMSGAITDYQSGIRDRFRQRANDMRQLRLDDLNRRQTELGMRNTEQNMNIAQQKLPGQLENQSLTNTGLGTQNNLSAQSLEQNEQMNPLLLENQANQNARQLLQNQGAAVQNAQAQQTLLQGAANDARWVGNHETGVVMRKNPYSGLDEDVTDQYSPAQIAAFKAAQKPAASSTSRMHPTLNRPLTAGELQRDKTFGKNIENFNGTAVAGNIGMLNMIADGLATQTEGDGATGLSWMAPIKSAARLLDREGDMGLRSIFDSESIDTQELVAGVIQKNLRETLGAQFTQREGMLLIQRAYNPQLSPQTNAKRLKAASMLADAYLKAQQAKVNHFNANGSIANYDPQLEQGLSAMEAQVRQVFAQNGGSVGSGSAATGTTSTGVGFSVTGP